MGTTYQSMDYKSAHFGFVVLTGVLFSVMISSCFDERHQTSIFKPLQAFHIGTNLYTAKEDANGR
jgi:hypothetical protein